MTIVDSNVLLDIFTDDRTWRSWSERALRDARTSGLVGINALIYAETSLAYRVRFQLEEVSCLTDLRGPLCVLGRGC